MLRPLRLLSDDPIRERDRDRLGLASWAEVVASAALGTEGPLSIGVFGRWGVGKTSVLHLARGLIESAAAAGRQQVTTVLFNAWQYEREETPLVPLIAAILQELERKRGGRSKPLKELRTALRAALYGMSVNISGKVPLLGEAGVALNAEKSVQRFAFLRSRWIDRQVEQSLYYNAFDVLRETQRAPAGSRHKVVVFVDDLDRCFPDRAIRLLESIKLVLSEPGFIFVLGVDRAVLETYLEKKLTQEIGFREYQRGQSYLAKFIQLPLWIPAHQSRFPGFIDRLLEESALAEWRRELLPLTREIGLACGYNPRQLIRFFNDLLVDRFIFQGEEVFPFRVFVAARGIRLQSEVAYHRLLTLPELCRKLHACRDVDAIREMVAGELAAAKEGDSHFDVLLRLHGNEELSALLASDAAREWLESGNKRALVEGVRMAREADDSTDLRAWIRAGTQRALGQIAAGDPEQVMAGCHWLSQFESPARIEAIPKLVELAAGDEPRIAAEAKRTLAIICSSVKQPQAR